jgi:hypothetical protein
MIRDCLLSFDRLTANVKAPSCQRVPLRSPVNSGSISSISRSRRLCLFSFDVHGTLLILAMVPRHGQLELTQYVWCRHMCWTELSLDGSFYIAYDTIADASYRRLQKISR